MGVFLSHDANLLLSNCVISLYGTANNSIPVYGWDAPSSMSADHCLVVYSGNNGRGFSTNAVGTIRNCASWGGNLVISAPNVVITCSASNTAGNNFVNIGSNPQTADYHLSPTSALRDSGCVGSALDLDSTRADIAVFGGQTPWVQSGFPSWPPVAYDLQIPLSVPQNGVMRVYSKGRVGPGQ
jgi:hypothetical protein